MGTLIDNYEWLYFLQEDTRIGVALSYNPGSLNFSGRNEMDPPLCRSTAMSHNGFTIREPIKPQEAVQ
jgi:hypothetical protein